MSAVWIVLVAGAFLGISVTREQTWQSWPFLWCWAVDRPLGLLWLVPDWLEDDVRE